MKIFNFHHHHPIPSDNNDFYNIDLHSHLLPNMDDGAETMEESLEIISFLKSLGIKKIITTPHISMKYPNSPEKILPAFEQLKKKVAEKNIGMELEVAAEYMIDEGFRDIFESGKLMTFGNNFVLIELAIYSPYLGFSDLLFEMQSQGYKIVLAHPERYLYWLNEFEKFKKLKDREIYFQMNILSLTKLYSAEAHKLAVKLINEKMIDFIGSDIHNTAYIPNICNTITKKIFRNLGNSGQIKNNTLLA